MNKKIFVRCVCLSLIPLIFSLSADADIVVKQDKDGKIIVSNVPSASSSLNARIRFLRSKKAASAPTSVPASYYTKIKRLSKKYQLREDLIVAVARAESSFDPFAVSHKGAVGLMQLMPDTARRYGVINRFNVDQNLEAGVKHLSYLYEKYKKNISLTLAAYNAGEEAVKKYNGIPPYRETRAYVRRAMKYMGLTYSSFFARKPNSILYKYTTADGRTVITDTLPSGTKAKVEVIR
jgi:soluble lytic murein transglycosylase-like protein